MGTDDNNTYPVGGSEGEDTLVAELMDEIKRLGHIISILKARISFAANSLDEIDSIVRVSEGRLAVRCFGEWVDVERAAAEAAEGKKQK